MKSPINWAFKQACTENGFTLKTLAERLRINRSYLSMFAHHWMNLADDEICRLSIVLNVPESELR